MNIMLERDTGTYKPLESKQVSELIFQLHGEDSKSLERLHTYLINHRIKSLNEPVADLESPLCFN